MGSKFYFFMGQIYLFYQICYNKKRKYRVVTITPIPHKVHPFPQTNVAKSQNGRENSNNQQSLFLPIKSFFKDENIWYLNTRCSNHMCGEK